MRPISIQIAHAVAAQLDAQKEYFRKREPGETGKTLAARFEEAVNAQIASLDNFPERGAIFRFRRYSREPVRWLGIAGFPRYLLFYRYSPSERRVRVINLRHSSMDNEAMLQEG